MNRDNLKPFGKAITPLFVTFRRVGRGITAVFVTFRRAERQLQWCL
jgi:hypothetical protein